MKRIWATIIWPIIAVTLFVLSSCTPADFDAAKTTTMMSGTCTVDKIGWGITYNKTQDKQTLYLSMTGASCEYDD